MQGLPERICVFCAKTFKPVRKTSTCCSRKCSRSLAMRKYMRKYRKSPCGRKKIASARILRIGRLSPIELAGLKALSHFRYVAMLEKFEADADAYAKYREKNRAKQRRQVDKHRKRAYIPRLSFRIPDWKCLNQDVLDLTSPFLYGNVTIGQRAYAKELFVERHEWKLNNTQS